MTMPDRCQARLDQDPLLTSVPEAEGYKVLGGVVLYQRLGQGGMGAAYRGRHVRLEVGSRRPWNGLGLAAGRRPHRAAGRVRTSDTKGRCRMELRRVGLAGTTVAAVLAVVVCGCAQKVGDAEANRHLGPAPTLSLDCGGGVTMDLIYIEPGRFTMGSPASEVGREDNETQHEVTITKGFYLGKYEVTQAQYQAVVGSNPSNWKEASRPVEQVTWNDATEFCNRLTQRAGKQVRLPTEAEWEYACRAGSTTRFCFGDSDGGLGEYAWFDGNSGNQTHAVGAMKPNAWGLYDMHGNVWEWCEDWYGSYPSGTVNDPTGRGSGRSRVMRGGSWDSDADYCSSASRNGIDPSLRDLDIGIRVAVAAAGP
jgi:formylglycine-generating enzyme required for sulfatase activity